MERDDQSDSTGNLVPQVQFPDDDFAYRIHMKQGHRYHRELKPLSTKAPSTAQRQFHSTESPSPTPSNVTREYNSTLSPSPTYTLPPGNYTALGSKVSKSAKSSKSSKSAKSSKSKSKSKAAWSTKSPTHTGPTISPAPTTSHKASKSSKSAKSSKSQSKSKSSKVAKKFKSYLAKSSKSSKSGKSAKSSKSKSSKSKSSKSKSSKSSKMTPDPPTLPPNIPNTPDDHYDDSCVKSDDGNSIICNSSTDFGLNGEWITLQSSLACSREIVEKVGFVDASQRMPDLCSCSATLTTYAWYILNIIDTVTPIDCGCFACSAESALGQRNAFGYRNLERPLLGAFCMGFDCNGRCNNQDADLAPIVIPLPPTDPILVPGPTPQPVPSPPNEPDCSVPSNSANCPPGPAPQPNTPTARPTPPPIALGRPSPAPQQDSAGQGSPSENVQTNGSGASTIAPSLLWVIVTMFLLAMGNRPARVSR